MTRKTAVRMQSEIYNNAHIQVAGQQLTVCGRSFSQNQNGKTLAWMIRVWIIPVWQIPIGKIPQKEILNKVIIKEIPMESNINLSILMAGGRECLSLLWTDGRI